MGPCIFQVRRELARLSKELFEDLAGMGVSVRVDVITQADYDASPYVTRHMDFSGDGAAVGTFITGVQASSGTWNEGEAYEQALLLANGLTWRASATKAFIVVGDDLPHPPTWPANEKRVDWQAEAQSLAARGVALYAVGVCMNGFWGVAAAARVARRRTSARAGEGRPVTCVFFAAHRNLCGGRRNVRSAAGHPTPPPCTAAAWPCADPVPLP